MARLPHGTRKRSDGTLEKRFSVNGQRFSVYGRNTREITEREQELREAIKQATYTRNADITLDQYFEEFQKQREGTIKETTAISTRSIYNNYFRDAIGKERVKKLEKRQIINVQQDLATRLKPTTVNLCIVKLKTILNGAVSDGIIVKNPAEGIKSLKTDHCEKATDTCHRALTEEEMSQFLTEAKEEFLYPFFLLSFSTGMRAGEITALRWQDIDEIQNVIHITKTLSARKGGWVETPPKTRTSVRDIPINQPIKQALKFQKENMLMMFGAQALKMDARIFLLPSGVEFGAPGAFNVIRKVLKRLDKKGIHIEHFSHHACRDTFATHYIKMGGNMQTLKTILGHSSLAMTMDLYSHVMPDTKQQEMNQIEDVFMRAAGK